MIISSRQGLSHNKISNFSENTIPTEMFTRQIRQNLKSVTVKITNAPKNPFYF